MTKHRLWETESIFENKVKISLLKTTKQSENGPNNKITPKRKARSLWRKYNTKKGKKINFQKFEIAPRNSETASWRMKITYRRTKIAFRKNKKACLEGIAYKSLST